MLPLFAQSPARGLAHLCLRPPGSGTAPFCLTPVPEQCWCLPGVNLAPGVDGAMGSPPAPARGWKGRGGTRASTGDTVEGWGWVVATIPIPASAPAFLPAQRAAGLLPWQHTPLLPSPAAFPTPKLHLLPTEPNLGGLRAPLFAPFTGRGGGVKLLCVSDELLSQRRQCSCSDGSSCGGEVAPRGPADANAARWGAFPHCLLDVIWKTFPKPCLCVWPHTHTLNVYFQIF